MGCGSVVLLPTVLVHRHVTEPVRAGLISSVGSLSMGTGDAGDFFCCVVLPSSLSATTVSGSIVHCSVNGEHRGL